MKKAASAAWAESGTACRDGGMIRFAALPVTDYNTAISTQVKARSQLLQTKYEYLFKIKTLTYYTNYYYGE